jgi:hypothetical protein
MALVNPNIAMSFRMPEFQAPNALAQYAQIQQIQSGQRQAEVADMQLAQMRQKEKAISDIQAKAAQGGGPTDRRAIARAYIQSGNPEFMQFGLTMETTLDELDAFQNIMGGGRGGAAAAPAAPAAGMGLPAGAQPPGDFTSTEAMGRVPGVVTSPIPDSPPMSAAMPAPANALAPTPPAPTNALTNPVAALRAKRDQLIALGTPRAIQAARSMDADIALMSKTTTASPGSVVLGPDGKVIFTAPAAPLTPQIKEIGVALGSNQPVYFDARTNEQFTSGRDAAGKPTRLPYTGGVNRSTSNVNMPKQESAFETGLGKGQSDRILANQVAAQDAAEILRTNQVGRDLLTSGAITGTGADFLVSLNNGLKQVGIDFGFADSAANSQAYVAALGSNVGRIVKQFGSGTALSDADREYAEKIAGGKIALTETALRKILDINDRASNRVIDLHNKNVAGIKTNIPLTVEKPNFGRPPAAASQIPTAAMPARAAPTPATARTVVRTGTLNGRRVVQYSDGSTEYGN